MIGGIWVIVNDYEPCYVIGQDNRKNMNHVICNYQYTVQFFMDWRHLYMNKEYLTKIHSLL